MITVAAAAAVVVIVDVVGPNIAGLLGRIGTGRNLACRLWRPETAASFGDLRYYRRRPIMLRTPRAAVAIEWGTSATEAGGTWLQSAAAATTDTVTAGEGVLLQPRMKSRLLVRCRWQRSHFIRWTSPGDHNGRWQRNGRPSINPRFGVRDWQLSVGHIGRRCMDFDFGLLLLLLLLQLLVSNETGG